MSLLGSTILATTINDSVSASAELVATLKKQFHLSEVTLVKLFEINVGWSLARPPVEEPTSPEDPFDKAAADALLAESLGIGQGPEAHETIGGDEDIPEAAFTEVIEDPTPEPVAV